METHHHPCTMLGQGGFLEDRDGQQEEGRYERTQYMLAYN